VSGNGCLQDNKNTNNPTGPVYKTIRIQASFITHMDGVLVHRSQIKKINDPAVSKNQTTKTPPRKPSGIIISLIHNLEKIILEDKYNKQLIYNYNL